LLALVPVVPFFVLYQMTAVNAGESAPGWDILNGPLSLGSVALHLRNADPFLIMGRRMVPFVDGTYAIAALSSPILWIGVLILLPSVIAAWRGVKTAYLVPFAAMLLLGMIAPDSLGAGAFVRQRLLLCAFVLLIPLVIEMKGRVTRRVVGGVLAAVFVFQVAALWEFAIKGDHDAANFLAAGAAVESGQTIGSIMIFEDPVRFNAYPLVQLVNVLGIRRDVVVWNNYETSYFFFPVNVKRPEDQSLVREFSSHFAIRPNHKEENFDERLAGMSVALEKSHDSLDRLVVWGRDARVEAEIGRWFDLTPHFESGNVRVLRRKG
jgi:hypothetical protein